MIPKSKVLIIAGSDSSGGAGIQADIKTVSALGCYAMTAITAVTVQNTTGVKSIIPIKPKEISNQIEFTARDIKPNAIKIGMLHSAKVISAVMKSLKKIDIKKIVLDPVMVAKGGTKLINNEAIDEIKKKLMKKILLITPNIPEAELLTNTKINSLNDMIKAGQLLINLGAKNVLIKGGHLKSNEINDILLNKKIIKIFKNKKYKSKNTHGTGCTLSSAIATNLSCGKDLIKSCEQGIKYVNEAIKSNLNYGKGNGPINHLNSITLNKKFK
ncbi:bifunctional hydroxymethylpyrimidine kinase/phosphomethylpyrimidine kinase [Candidatus Pelagibacter bacterium]|jgi:hydroxymethylpyrimidine/phosphomethylpyrimidine kinase|nr:bifunctional hydroxymethylpyrimidine kinase/phosphomethylpyrimidine kinase [Candidatus Pelagibacter bacterium]MDA8772496.1 bifunctional hydroxymethylpyrimidine kinase/phosphomethylpyrimidine kinase [Candidatus Pelagibacter bacterium]